MAARGSTARTSHKTIKAGHTIANQKLAEEATHYQPETQVIKSPYLQPLQPQAGKISTSAQLARNNFRPMDPTSGQGLSDQMDQRALPDYASHYLHQVSRSLSINGGRGPGTFSETGNSSCPLL